jgi:pimeloyl-ACP methyl ester carboxylesterase/catechol 2,3-dioxygenase-like lactoylglutathione lyase family enzyme
MVSGISHVTLIVQDIAKTSFLFQYLLDGIEVYSSDSRNFSLAKEKFLLVGGIWLALMEGPSVPKSYNHIAFQIQEEDIPLYLARMKELNIQVLEGRKRVSKEGSSVYFYDYDNHLFELHTGNLDTRLKFYETIEMRKHTRFVQSKQIRLWTETIGNPNNPAVVFICGAGAHAHFWTNEFCQQIATNRYFVIRFDHRDIGFSTAVDFKVDPYTVQNLAEDVISILDAYGIKQAHVVGHSMGGTVAQLLAINYSDRLLSFTSMSVATVGKVLTPSKEIMDALLENQPTQVYEESLEGFMKSWSVLNGDFPLNQEMAESYTKELYHRSLHPVGVAWNHIHCQESLGDLSAKLEKVSTPALFIHGEKDPLIPVEGGIKTAQTVKDAKIKVIPRMGHMIFDSNLQEKIASILVQHFQSAAQQRCGCSL